MAVPRSAPPDSRPPDAEQSEAEQSRAESSSSEPNAAPAPTAHSAQPKAAPLAPAEAATQQRAVAALFLALLSLFGLLGLNNLQRGIYIAAFSVVAGVLAVRLSVTSIYRARRSGTMWPRGSVAATVIGAIGMLLSSLLLIGLVVFGSQATAYSQCLSGANTVAAQQACQNQFVHAVENRASRG
jgi:hypothetical protein